MTDGLLMKLDSTGALPWSKAVMGSGYDFGHDISVASDNSIMWFGAFESGATLDGISLTTQTDGADGFVAHVRADGSALNVLSVPGQGISDLAAMAVNPCGGGVRLLMSVSNPVDTGCGSVFNTDAGGMLIVELDANLAEVWRRTLFDGHGSPGSAARLFWAPDGSTVVSTHAYWDLTLAGTTVMAQSDGEATSMVFQLAAP